MTTDSNHDENTDESNSSNTTDPGAFHGALDRLEDDDVDETATLVEHLKIAQEFDEAEACAETIEPLSGGPMLGAHRYLVTGDVEDEWLASNYTVAIGFDGGNSR
ncbi:hypothetical protein [Natrinema salifodinae]|uniref:Uncharacterized protein n=1 Tax=Natrinema salifodinae TaxID=1202768 RepID=A0A1I0P8V8_9EURY|nr:hypothetical protein [Natrinema salifodinae]SEW09976.1 hypothetical protein SAMN05216285_2209 [Natrinema salifodinae]